STVTDEKTAQRLKCSSIHLDESTDVSDCATLLVYVRCVWETEFVEDLLCCLNIPNGTKGEQIFSVLSNYVVTECGLSWANCKGITSDGAANMTGRNSESRRQLVKTSALNSRLFDQLCAGMGADHTHLLFHAEVRWLSKGRGLTRIYELRNEIHAFLLEKKSSLAEMFTEEWLFTVSYLADIFSSLNELCLKLQGQNDDVFQNWKHILTFQKSLKLWLAQFRSPKPSHYMFPTVLKHIEDNDVTDTQVKHLTGLIVAHLVALIDNFEHYFPKDRYDILHDKRWIQHPFDFESPESLLELGLTASEETELLQLSSGQTLKRRHESMTLSSFWVSISSEYPVLSKASILLLIPFTTTYKCEAGFSVLTKIKTKYRNRLNAAPDMRVALSSCTPNWDVILKNKQAHLSHYPGKLP
uniref:HAT C-terminal dimerisation domain-containing protein n=1 Tax=Gouania willdenowi TaxID=441366 RepID=A0A8C5HK32_GOUWI